MFCNCKEEIKDLRERIKKMESMDFVIVKPGEREEYIAFAPPVETWTFPSFYYRLFRPLLEKLGYEIVSTPAAIELKKKEDKKYPGDANVVL